MQYRKEEGDINHPGDEAIQILIIPAGPRSSRINQEMDIAAAIKVAAVEAEVPMLQGEIIKAGETAQMMVYQMQPPAYMPPPPPIIQVNANEEASCLPAPIWTGRPDQSKFTK